MARGVAFIFQSIYWFHCSAIVVYIFDVLEEPHVSVTLFEFCKKA